DLHCRRGSSPEWIPERGLRHFGRTVAYVKQPCDRDFRLSAAAVYDWVNNIHQHSGIHLYIQALTESSGTLAITDRPDGGQDELEALRRQAHRLRSALDGAGQGVWDHNMETGEIYFSDMWKRRRGYAPHEDVDSIAGPWLDRLHPDDRPRILETIERQN